MHDATRPARRARLLFVALTNDVGTDRLPAALGALGADCAVLCPPGFYCAETRFMARRFSLPAQRGLWLALPFLRRRLEIAAREWDADFVIPLDDMSALCLRVIATAARVSPHLRSILETSLGPPIGYASTCSRAGLMFVAADLGLLTPRVCVSSDSAIMLRQAQAWGYPVVLKEENTCGGHGVTIAHTPEELRRSMMRIQGASFWRRLRRTMRRYVWHLAGLGTATGAPPVLQSYLSGVPAMRTVFAWKGKVLEGVSFLAEQNHPAPTGPSSVVRHIENAAMAETARRLVAALGCSGFISLDFMLDETTNEAALIELNARPIGTVHLGRLFGHDLCSQLLACLDRGFGTPPSRTAHTLPLTRVALFPKEIERLPQDLGRFDDHGLYHDLPRDEPHVMAAYLRRLRAIHPQEFRAIRDRFGAAALRAVVPARRPMQNGGGLDWLPNPSAESCCEPRWHARG